MSARKCEITNIAAFSFVLWLVRFRYSSIFPENSEKTFVVYFLSQFSCDKKRTNSPNSPDL